MPKCLLRVGVEQRLAGTVDLPDLVPGGDFGGVDGVAGAGDHAVALQGHHARRGGESVDVEHPRLAEEGLDDLRLDGRDALLQRLDILAARYGHSGQLEAGLGAAPVEHDDLARVDAVRVLDFFRVHLPQLAPAVGILEKLGRDSPQGIAGRDDMAVGRAVGQLQRLGPLGDCQGG